MNDAFFSIFGLLNQPGIRASAGIIMPKFNSMSDLHFRPAPLTTLTEDEQMLRDAAADFAREAIAPHVHDMDQQALLRPDIIRGCFEQGLMGIEIPEEYDGAGGSFFMSILAIEEISRVDPAVGVFVDVHNTLVINAFNHWGSDDLKKTLSAPPGDRYRGRLCLVGGRLGQRCLRPETARRKKKATAGCSTGTNCGLPTEKKPAFSSSSPL